MYNTQCFAGKNEKTSGDSAGHPGRGGSGQERFEWLCHSVALSSLVTRCSCPRCPPPVFVAPFGARMLFCRAIFRRRHWSQIKDRRRVRWTPGFTTRRTMTRRPPERFFRKFMLYWLPVLAYITVI